MPGKLDEISEAIGELKGSLKAIDKYIHEREHNIANLGQKVDGVGALVSREVARLKGELEGKLDNLAMRVTALELSQQRQVVERGLVRSIFESPLLAWLFAAAVALWTWLKAQGKAP